MYCRNCGLEVPRSNWFCSRCGQGAPRFQDNSVRSLALGLAIASLVFFIASTLYSCILYQRYSSHISLVTLFGGVQGIVASVASLAAAVLLILALARRSRALLTASASARVAMSFVHAYPAIVSLSGGGMPTSHVLQIVAGLAGLLTWILILLFVLSAKKGLLIAGACAAAASVILGMARTLDLYMGMVAMMSAAVTIQLAFLLLGLLPPAATLLARFAMPGKRIAASNHDARV